jgi:TRAP-type mannitol/chloroaromatic compound transport system substrate-binding protein
MERRNFVRQALGLAAGGVAASAALIGCGSKGGEGGAAPAVHTQKKFQWRMVMVVPKTFKIWGEGMVDFANRVKLMSGGRLEIKVYGGKELVPEMETFDTVKNGTVEMGHSAAYYWQGKLPAAVFFTSVPFGMNTTGMTAWLKAGGGQQLWEELYAEHEVYPLACGNTGIQMGGWFKKEIRSAADFKGLKMRMPGLGGKVIARMGATPELLPGADIFLSLETGVIDATEWVGPYHDFLMGFHKVAKYYYAGGWHEPGSVLELIINKKAWDSLPADLQQIVRSCAAETDRTMYAQWQAKDAEYFKKIQDGGQTIIKEFPAELMSQIKTISAEVLEEVAATGPLAQRIYTSFKDFQGLYENFQRHNEQSYERAQRA